MEIVYRLCILILLPIPCAASSITTYTYLQTNGSRTDTATKVISATDTTRYIHYKDTRGYTSESICTPCFMTKSWTVNNTHDSTAIRIVRKGSKLYFNGTVKNHPVRRTKTIGTVPWLQAIEFALAPSNRDNIPETSFWIVRLTDFSVHKMKFRKAIKTINSRDTTSTLVITPSGIPAQIWHAKIRYSQKNGDFISSLFPSFFPGKKATVVKLLSTY